MFYPVMSRFHTPERTYSADDDVFLQRVCTCALVSKDPTQNLAPISNFHFPKVFFAGFC